MKKKIYIVTIKGETPDNYYFSVESEAMNFAERMMSKGYEIEYPIKYE